MKTEQEIRAKITEIEDRDQHVLTGSMSSLHINAPRALMQLSVETKLKVLHWVLGDEYKSKLKGTDT